mgnify:CR=1 FL=1
MSRVYLFTFILVYMTTCACESLQAQVKSPYKEIAFTTTVVITDNPDNQKAKYKDNYQLFVVIHKDNGFGHSAALQGELNFLKLGLNPRIIGARFVRDKELDHKNDGQVSIFNKIRIFPNNDGASLRIEFPKNSGLYNNNKCQGVVYMIVEVD